MLLYVSVCIVLCKFVTNYRQESELVVINEIYRVRRIDNLYPYFHGVVYNNTVAT